MLREFFPGIGLLYKVDAGKPPNLWSFMDVFHIDVWLYLLASYILSSIMFFIVGRCGHITTSVCHTLIAIV